MLLLSLILLPLAGALVLVLTKKKSWNVPLITCSIVLALAVFGLQPVFGGQKLALRLSLPGPFSPVLQADSLSAVFIILAALLWFVIAIYAPKYMVHEGRTKVFELVTLLTFSAVLGVFTAGDLVTMLLFFELMTITSFFWVVHRWNRDAIRAGYFYLFFSIIGGLLIALGIVLMGAAAGLPLPIGAGQIVPNSAKLFSWALGLLVVGFGIKGGMAPLHLWLPHAHSNAPTPGSALLSGLLIKVGAYGLIRVGEFAGWGQTLGAGASWLGSALTVLGLLTMLIGVIAALLQGDGKRLLAYHSVSQMGYIILGLGMGLYLGPAGGLSLVGGIYHIVNHALFKAALFLGVGVIYIHTKETDLYKLGGLWRRFPVTAILMLLAAMGITGAPGLNGYASKTVLHHAVSTAAATGLPWLIWTERLFSLVGIGTAASFAKLYYLIFLGKPTELEVSENESPRLQLAMAILAAVMLVIGLNPQLFPNALALPAAEALGFHELPRLSSSLFWNFADLKGIVITLALGIGVCWAGLKTSAFHWQPPIWLTLEGLGGKAYLSAAAVWAESIAFFQNCTETAHKLGDKLSQRLSMAYDNLVHPKDGAALTGISAAAALLIVTLMALIAWYTMINPGLDALKIFNAWLQH